MRMGIYALERLIPPKAPAPGRIVPASAHPSVLVEWMKGFEEDTGIFSTGAEENVRRILAADGLFVWEVDGRPVSMAGLSGATPNGARVGYVYTPPEARGNGYASAVTAGVTRRCLESGRRFCFLYTNLADPVSNGIYRRLGYRKVADACSVRFQPIAD